MLANLVIQSGLYIGIAVILVLCWFTARNRNNIFLGLTLLATWYALLASYFNYTGEWLQYPQLVGTGNLAGYLIYPFLYLYIRNTFNPQQFFTWKDGWVFSAALLYMADMSSYFFAPVAEKIAAWQHVLSDPNIIIKLVPGAFMPAAFHFVFRFAWSFLFYVLQWRVLIKNRMWLLAAAPKKQRIACSFNLMLLLLFFPLVVPGLVGVIFRASWFFGNYINIMLAVTLVIAALYILLSPSVLYGFYTPEPFSPGKTESARLLIDSVVYKAPENINVPEDERMVIDVPEKRLAAEKVSSIKLIIENYLQQTPAYTNPGYSINGLSKETGVPVYQLSLFINNYYGCNFSNWTNKLRVEYFLKLTEDSVNKNLTLEALAQKAGFKSRVTFINAFKKEKGLTPTTYLKQKA